MKTVDMAAFYRGVNEFNAGRYFECHDTLEEIWMVTSGDERLFLQGLIQVSVGFYHFGNGNPSGALSQWGKGTAKLSGLGNDFGGVQLGLLLHDVREWSKIAIGQLSGARVKNITLKPPKLEFS
jgi:predicted metal-dependent hydrolase